MSALPQTVPARPSGEARPLRIPAPRPASDQADAGHGIRIPSPRVPSDTAPPAGTGTSTGTGGEHGKHRAVVAPMSPGEKVLLVAGRAGSLTTLAALLVMSAAFAGAVDGTEPTGPAAQVATTTLR
ncbi:MAG: hypothetical protein L0I76_12060 [Pseudonocardia sp.]|nr:hypothetical protein [Pseudonocardia sp.]